MHCVGTTNGARYVYTVRYGDTVDSISEKYTGDRNRWPELVQSNRNYPVERVNINGDLYWMFKDLRVGQTLTIPNTWLPPKVRRIPSKSLKTYGYSWDIYRFNDNPRIWLHNKPLDFYLVETFFLQCHATLPKCPGSKPYMQKFYDYNTRLMQLWGANLDKPVVTIGERCGQYKPVHTLGLESGDIVKIPADWPDPTRKHIVAQTRLIELNRMLIPLDGPVTPKRVYKWRVTRGPLHGFGTFNSDYYRIQRWGGLNVNDYMEPGF